MIRAYATAASAERITISSLVKIAFTTAFLVGAAAQCFAQTSIPLPERKALFAEDRKNAKRAEKRALKSVLARDAVANKDMDLRAPRIEYSKDGKTIQGAGGVSLKSGSLSIESDQIAVQTESKDAAFSGAVTVNSPQAKIVAAGGTTNLDSEAGTFNCAKVRFEESNYQARAGTVKKLDDERFEFQDARFTTCSCPGEGSGSTDTCNESSVPPWSIDADSISMTRDGYAFAKWASLRLGGVPIFYSPWLGFPTKEERQSGLLAPTFGYSSNDGFRAEIPLFVTLGQTADATLTPFIETKSRVGLNVGYRQKFSRYNQLNSKFYLSDESARDGSLRGTNVSGLFDPTFDENRTGVLLEHYWRSEKESGVDLTYIADVRYVSDDLFLREIPDTDIGDSTQTSTVSRAVVRGGLGEYGVAELSGEYVQALDEQDDDLVFKRLPELNVNLSKSWRPFGYNDYGVKVVTALNYLGDEFYRSQGYDGTRSHVVPSVTVPFHVGPYVQGYSSLSFLRTDYWLDDATIPSGSSVAPRNPGESPGLVDDRNQRNLPIVSAGLSTAVERIYSLDSDSWLTKLTSWGAGNQDETLKRVKHTIEPFTRFTGIPDRDQEDLPIFDSIDRIGEKRSLAYGVRTSLYGRFLPESTVTQGNNDLVGRAKVLPGTTALSSAREEEDLGRVTGGARVRNGDSRELVTFVAKQNFDILEYSRDRREDDNGLSDLDAALYLFPTPQFALGLDSTIDTQDGELSSWGVSTNITTDAGHAFGGKWDFVRDSITQESLINQFEGSAEVVLTNQLRAGVYSRMDALRGSSLESRGALRYVGSCRCWHIDLGYGQRANPKKNEVLLSFTLLGLGDIAQAVRVDNSGSAN